MMFVWLALWLTDAMTLTSLVMSDPNLPVPQSMYRSEPNSRAEPYLPGFHDGAAEL